MRTPLLVVTGVDATAMDSVMVSLSWDLPRAVAVRHRIDPHTQVLTRVVSDATGVLEQEHIPLEHACVGCALREDILPTLERLARDGRWNSIVAGLPTGTEAAQLTGQLSRDGRLARRLRLSSVVAAVGTTHVARDLLSDDLLRERDLHTNPDDERGVGEVACAQIELADVVVLDEDPGPEETDLVRALAHPQALVLTAPSELDSHALLAQRHQHRRAMSWSSPGLETEVPHLADSHAWRLDLSSPRPFHPERLLEQVELLGTGPHRARGTFWLPTRPGSRLEWSGSGGQLSIGMGPPWGRQAAATRLVLTGLGTAPPGLVTAFEELLLTPTEALLDHHSWDVLEDGLEPWLGDIRDVA